MKIEKIIDILNETKEETKKELEKFVAAAVDKAYSVEEREKQKIWKNAANEYAIAFFYDNLLIKLLSKELENDNRNT